ncbi:MAG: hypothetical protein KA368_10395 [Acidobacteria bacterium]|nr:hypothetical protein [Acidobacteriota bacterium]
MTKNDPYAESRPTAKADWEVSVHNPRSARFEQVKGRPATPEELAHADDWVAVRASVGDGRFDWALAQNDAVSE